MINNKIKFKIIYIPVALMLLCGALVIGITDYIVTGFSLENIRESSFWVNIALTNIGIICIVIAILLIGIDKFKDNDEHFKEIKNSIWDYRKSPDYQSSFMNKFCDEKNKEEKIYEYKEHLRRKYTKLKPTYKDIYIFENGTKEEKQNNKYCQERILLEKQMSDEYINKNINNLSIKYNTITEALIFSGMPTDSATRDYVTKNKAGKIAKDLLPKYLITFAITVLTAVATIDFKDGVTLTVVFKTCSKLFSICSQIYFAINYSNKYCNEVVLHDMQFRFGLINQFKLWLANKIKKVENKEVTD